MGLKVLYYILYDLLETAYVWVFILLSKKMDKNCYSENI